MFQNSNASHLPKLQPSRSLQQLAKTTHSSLDPPGVSRLVGSTQHLKNLGKAVGAKVNDLLRRKDCEKGDVGVTEVNKTVVAVLSGSERTLCRNLDEGELSKFMESFPRLEPPPPVVKKRTPRALKTTQDMMISSSPVLSSPEKQVDASSTSFDMTRETLNESAIQDNPKVPNQQPNPLVNGRAETDIQEQTENHTGNLFESVPDLLHKEKSEASLRMASSNHIDKVDMKSCISQDELLEEEVNNSDLSLWPRNSNLDSEGPHPDLLSFE
ncbi:uncharacterized protein C1orf226 homolog [Rhinophrynus dorsalis]